MAQVVGNIGYAKGPTQPTRTDVIWAKVLDPLQPNIVEHHIYNNGVWVPIGAAVATAQFYQLPVLTMDLVSPPALPAAGDRYIVGWSSPATGAWTGFERHIAEWTGAAWDFTAPINQMMINIADRPNLVFFYNSAALVWIKQYRDKVTRIVTASGPVLPGDECIGIDSTAGPVVLDLPADLAAGLRPGRELEICDVNNSAGTNAQTINGNGQNIDGRASETLEPDEREYRTITYYPGHGWRNS